jgi:hypothetical protein
LGIIKSEQMRMAQVRFIGKNPLEIIEEPKQGSSELNIEQQNIAEKVGEAIISYLNAVEVLFQGKYAHLKEVSPIHLTNPGSVLIICCQDGVAIRYEQNVDGRKVFAGWTSGGLTDIVSGLSQQLIHCYQHKEDVPTVPATDMEIKLSVFTPSTNTKREMASLKVGCDIVLSHPDILPSPPQKPFCLLSINNTVELCTTGELISDDTHMQKGQRFLTRTFIRLPVGWECIEIFPFLNLEYWKLEYASTWAENDILAAVVAQQYRESQFQSLDPKLAARRQFAQLLQNYKDLLDSNPEREEVLQSFLRDHPSLLCPTHTRFWPKLPLGARETDLTLPIYSFGLCSCGFLVHPL